jgi:2,4-dienoyl-CoA reductase-like NADH-dependent reductase (Old Yellow Enzyme family)
MVAVSGSNHTFPHLFSAFDFGGVGLRNRIVMLPMTTGFCEPDQSVGDRLIGFYAARAAGGAGLLAVPFSPVATGSPVDAGLYDDRLVPVRRDSRKPSTATAHESRRSSSPATT